MDKASRPVRNRRHSRRAWPAGEIHRPQKRLFTPEIKRMLKDWLVRRRDNPYPSREEKKALAIKTGLTYIQICNWFANWRRKLKNAGREPQKKTWGHLIKNYNTSANGNVEQFSICSSDSIWGDEDRPPGLSYDHHRSHHYIDSMSPVPPMQSANDYHECGGGSDEIGNHPMTITYNNNGEYDDRFGELMHAKTSVGYVVDGMITGVGGCDKEKNRNFYNYFSPGSTTENVIHNHGYAPRRYLTNSQEQCFQITSTTNNTNYVKSPHNVNNINHHSDDPTSAAPPIDGSVKQQSSSTIFSNVKYKNNIMEKYLRGLNSSNNNKTDGLELSKWLESAANFTPKKNNYIEWDTAARNKANLSKSRPTSVPCAGGGGTLIETVNHQKEELEAAEVLTSLAGNYRNRMFNAAAAAAIVAKH